MIVQTLDRCHKQLLGWQGADDLRREEVAVGGFSELLDQLLPVLDPAHFVDVWPLGSHPLFADELFDCHRSILTHRILTL
jgi:hypothetical protein